MVNMNQKRNFILTYLPWLWLIAGAVIMLIYQIGPGRALVDGDMGGEMILADLLNKEGDFLLSDNWYYATEIHVFFLQIIYRPLLLIFPNNWHIVRVISAMLIYGINTLGYLLMMKELGVKKPAVWGAGTLLWPMGMWRLFLGLYGTQYLVYDFFMFYILWLIFYICNTNGKSLKRILAIVFLAALSLIGGINGVRETMMLFAPIGVGAVVLVVVRFFTCQKNVASFKECFDALKSEIKLLIIIVCAAFINLVGYAFNVLVLLRRYSFQSNTKMLWKEKLSFTDIIDAIADYFSLFGFTGEVKLLSIDGLCSLVGVLVAFVLIVIVVRLCIRRSSLSMNEQFILYTFIGGLLMCSIIFGMLQEMNEPRFWLPFLPFGIMLFEIEGDTEDWKFPGMKTLVGVLLSLMIVVTSVGALKGELERPHEGKMKSMDMSQYLATNGYTQGYTQYWLANTIQEQTNGRVQARPLMYYETFEMMPWSNRIDYTTTYPEGEVFLVLDKKSYPGDVHDCYAMQYADVTVTFEDDDWIVLLAPRAEELEKAYELALTNSLIDSQ